MKRILVTGSAAYDLLLGYDGSFLDGIDREALARLSMAFVTPHFARHHGGTGANIAWTLRLLSQNPLLVSTVGSDGGPYLSLLEERGVSTRYVEKLEQAMTATAIIGTDTSEHQITFYHPGADAVGTWPDLGEERDDIAYAIVSPREERVMLEGVRWCKEQGISVLFDPGQRIMSFAKDDLLRAIGQSGGIIANAYEWSLLVDKLGMVEQEFLELAPVLIVTHGEDGLSIITQDGVENIRACAVDAMVNPTGAGDALRAGILSGLASGWSLTQSARLGAAVASFVVEIEGTLLDSLDLDEVRERARQAYGEQLPSL